MRATPIAACALAVLALDDAVQANPLPLDTANASFEDTAVAPREDAASQDKMEAIAPLAAPERATPERGALRVGRSLPHPATTSPTAAASLPSTPPNVAVGLQAEETSRPMPLPVAAVSEPEVAASLESIERSTPSSTLARQSEEAQSIAAQPATFEPPTGDAAELVNPDGSFVIADVPPPPPPAEEIEALQNRLRDIEAIADFGDTFEGSPAITIAIPSGYGADEGIGFVSTGFQSSVRGSDEADATATFGVGLGDAEDAVGVQLSYTIASFGTNRDFGTGGFNAKVHRRISDNVSIAAGWDGFISVGDDNDFEDSVYGAVTYVGELNPDINDAFSRIALTAGVGNGRFRTEDAILDEEDTVGVFGSAALRIARPVSAIVEWTGQDLALGVSIAPFRDFPLVITPAFRDLAGAGDEARFVLGANLSFRF